MIRIPVLSRLAFWAGCLGLLCLTAVPASAQDGAWRASRPMDTARSNSGAAVLDGQIYVAGGASVLGPRDVFEVYDTSVELWRPLPALPEGRERFGMTAMGAQIYLTGGYEAQTEDETADLWIYDTVESEWREGPAMPAGRAGHAMIAHDGRLYAFGGVGPGANRTVVYDPGTGKWAQASWTLPERRSDFAAFADDGQLYVLGGRVGTTQSARVDRLDLASGRWQRLTDMPRARSGHTAAMIKGRIHVTGGVAQEMLKTYSEHDVMSVSSSRWAAATPLPTPRHGLVSAAVNGRWYVIGGGSGAGVFAVFTEADVVEVFEPSGS